MGFGEASASHAQERRTSVDAANVRAEYRAGVLTVRLPPREESKPKQIKVQIAA